MLVRLDRVDRAVRMLNKVSTIKMLNKVSASAAINSKSECYAAVILLYTVVLQTATKSQSSIPIIRGQPRVATIFSVNTLPSFLPLSLSLPAFLR
ncbi:hypothetical protein MPTK1_5g13850 [Marchantia polymorpha subsp. ruderalis]|uniref:Uncharacterized protein n=2 Tax=Marchantia polymorpha TaxID=3197 RepID=A0AAF6BI38_MARPO|nr:hypothetical protein MARPO_0032s0075 [Marchantia polymorpha]BBN11672.1 hypothetical protein Mp_5g13850 [Marchantia polymorpha subsp. ruderalis]|eukprot:PTQ41886.1 hypothetical protein MARPO_0032s0075 [Marchantia polymorpha]